MERRRLLAVLTVNSVGDAGDFNLSDTIIDADSATAGEQRTLRAVIQNHNDRLRTEPNQVVFDIGAGTPTINVGATGNGALPTILGSLSINGNTGGATRVELNGTSAGTSAMGLQLRGFDCVIESLVINRFGSNGIIISGTGPPGDGGHTIRNCLIGTDSSGGNDQGNGLHGIYIEGGTPNNTIGGAEAGSLNVISGNGGDGILIDAPLRELPAGTASNRIIGNHIGVNLGGTGAIANDSNGVHIVAHNADVIQANVISANKKDGVNLFGVTAVQVVSNRIGTNSTATAVLGNTFNGIHLEDSFSNFIGVGGSGNVIGGNTLDGLRISGATSILNTVQGNFIGTNSGQFLDLGNLQSGLVIDEAGQTTVGGLLTSNTPNVIGFNRLHGVRIDASNDNTLFGNAIGTDRSGQANLGNGMNGIRVENNSARNRIGGAGTGQGNVIGFNGSRSTPLAKGHGIVIVSGTQNAIRRNFIYENKGRGIDLGNNSFNVNDANGDADTGANTLQDYPVVVGVTFAGATRTIEWVLNSTPSTAYTIEFFHNDAADSTGFGEGRRFLRDRSVSTNASGNVLFTETFAATDTFISATATDPNGNTSEFSMVDSDGDAIADGWETNGIDFNEDGTVDLTLAGANPWHKDLYVEADTMVGRAPSAAALATARIGSAGSGGFDNAPNTLVQNPDGADGINLHVDVDETNIPLADIDDSFANFDTIKAARFGTPAQRGSAAAIAAKKLVYRYVLFGDTYAGGGSSGYAELPNVDRNIDPFARNDFIVTLGAWTPAGGTNDEQAGTLMHEMGHTLGLHHGGNDDINYKPNYHSVMSYTWQTPQTTYAASWAPDYSRRAFPNLDESNLDEAAGIGGHAGHRVPIGPVLGTHSPEQIVDESGAVNYNRNAVSTDVMVSRDINFLGDTNGDGVVNALDASPGETLNGYEDWSHLRYYFVESPAFADGAHGVTTANDEKTFADKLRLDQIGGAIVNQPPVLNPIGNRTVQVGGTLAFQVSASDPNAGAVLTFSLDPGAPAGASINSLSGQFSFTPTTGPASFVLTIRVTDNGSPALSDLETITIHVTAGRNHAPKAKNDHYTTRAGQQLTVAAPGVVANDRDRDGDSLSAILVKGPRHGMLTLNANGSFVYQPKPGFHGMDRFSYRASDGQSHSKPAKVFIQVKKQLPQQKHRAPAFAVSNSERWIDQILFDKADDRWKGLFH